MDMPRAREDVREDMRDDLETITDQISDGIEQGRYSLSQLQESLVILTKQSSAYTDELVLDYRWRAIGVGVALGVLIGFLIPRR